MEKTTLAKLCNDSLDNALAGKSTAEKFEKYAKEVLAIEDFGEVTVNEGKNNEDIVSHETVRLGRLLLVQRVFDALVLTGSVKYVKQNLAKMPEDILNAKVAEAEEYFSHCKNNEMAKRALGEIYTKAIHCCLPNEAGVAKIRRYISAAEERMIPMGYLKDALKSPSLTADIINLLENAEVAQNKLCVKNLLESVLPQVEATRTVCSGSMLDAAAYVAAGTVGAARAVRPDPLTDEYVTELIKSDIESHASIPEEARAALTSPDAKVEIALLFCPARATKWTSTPAEYYWKYIGHDGITVTQGSFTYGGASKSEFVECGEPVLNRFISDTVDNYGDEHFFSGEATDDGALGDLDPTAAYIPAHFPSSPPSGLIPSDSEAHAWICKERRLQINKYDSKFFRCLQRATYDYEHISLVYFPVYSVRIEANGYVVKALVDGYDTSNTKICEAAHVSANDVNYYVSESGATDLFKTRSEKEKAKLAAKRAFENKHGSAAGGAYRTVLNIASIVASIAGYGLGGGELGALHFIPFIITLIFGALAGRTQNKGLRILLTVVQTVATIAALGVLFLVLGGGGGDSSAVN